MKLGALQQVVFRTNLRIITQCGHEISLTNQLHGAEP